MHIPDGFMNATTSAAAGAVAAGGLGAAVRKAAVDLDDRRAPLAGLVAAFVFAAQMINFPVAAGTSGHLIGGAMAAVLVGPWTACICLAVVVLVQALFADGGITALGLNLVNLALVGTLGGYAVFLAVRRLLPLGGDARVVAAAASGAFASVVLAATAFVAEYAMGGAVDLSIRAVFGAMVGVHAVIGIGEAVITAMTVRAVLAIRPDLVHGRLQPRPLDVREAPV